METVMEQLEGRMAGGWCYRRGEEKKMGEGYKGSQISDRQELPPQRKAITGEDGVEEALWWDCHQGYWQSVSQAAERRGE